MQAAVYECVNLAHEMHNTCVIMKYMYNKMLFYTNIRLAHFLEFGHENINSPFHPFSLIQQGWLLVIGVNNSLLKSS